MRHADDGALRRMLDEPFAVSTDVKRHIEGCAECTARAAAMADEARVAASALGDRSGFGAADPAAAYARFMKRATGRTRVSMTARLRAFAGGRNRRYVGPAVGVLAAAAVVVALVFTPIGTLAQSFLTIFEPHQFVAINVSKGELQYMPDLASFGTMTQRGAAEHREVGSPRQAFALTHITPRLPAFLPPGLPQPVHYVVVSPVSASFQFSAARALAYAMAAHKPVPPMPRDLDGSVLSLRAGPMFVVVYGTLPPAPVRRDATAHVTAGGTTDVEGNTPGQHVQHIEHDDVSEMPALAIVEAVAPRVYSTGATAQEIESYLLQMPGVAPQLADEIRAIGDPSTTMPIPVPIDKAYSQYVSIDGTRGLAVGDDTGVGGIVIWQRNGIVYGVGGGLPQRTLMEVAQSLR